MEALQASISARQPDRSKRAEKVTRTKIAAEKVPAKGAAPGAAGKKAPASKPGTPPGIMIAATAWSHKAHADRCALKAMTREKVRAAVVT